MTIITITTPEGVNLSLPWGSNHTYRRQEGSVTIRTESLAGTEIGVEYDLTANGEIVIRRVGAYRDGGAYALLVLATEKPSKAQRRVIARAWLNIERPMMMSPGQELCVWAFEGLTPEEVNRRYGDGRKIFLTGSPHT